MRIAQPVTTHAGDYGYVVYSATGALLCLVIQQPGRSVALKMIIGPHVLLNTVLSLTARQWSQLVTHCPGIGGLSADR